MVGRSSVGIFTLNTLVARFIQVSSGFSDSHVCSKYKVATTSFHVSVTLWRCTDVLC